jgi:hypothetical protein
MRVNCFESVGSGKQYTVMRNVEWYSRSGWFGGNSSKISWQMIRLTHIEETMKTLPIVARDRIGALAMRWWLGIRDHLFLKAPREDDDSLLHLSKKQGIHTNKTYRIRVVAEAVLDCHPSGITRSCRRSNTKLRRWSEQLRDVKDHSLSSDYKEREREKERMSMHTVKGPLVTNLKYRLAIELNRELE